MPGLDPVIQMTAPPTNLTDCCLARHANGGFRVIIDFVFLAIVNTRDSRSCDIAKLGVLSMR
jgi:hypothetical protein